MTHLTDDEIKELLDGAMRGPYVVREEEIAHYLQNDTCGPHVSRTIRTAWTHPQLKDQDFVMCLAMGVGKVKSGPMVPYVWSDKENADLLAASWTIATQCLAQSEALKAKDAEIERLQNEVSWLQGSVPRLKGQPND